MCPFFVIIGCDAIMDTIYGDNLTNAPCCEICTLVQIFEPRADKVHPKKY